jgi:type III pantothenate kinase
VAAGLWLLIGNSRWHWAESLQPDDPAGLQPANLHCWHTPAPSALSTAELGRLRSWACVGQLPADLRLPPEQRLGLEAVPLRSMPAWLGVDRALAGYEAWRRQRAAGAGGAVLVADAGTALSLTRVNDQGAFAGGRLMAGLRLQLSALAAATAQLPDVPVDDPCTLYDLTPWPAATETAMAAGCLWGLAAAIGQAAAALQADGPAGLWLTGGDAPLLAPLLGEMGQRYVLAPGLCLEALAALRPA